MGPSEYYQAGQLQEAIDAALSAVKKAPTDTSKRFQLCELFCFAGDLERADKQLDTIMQQTVEGAMEITLRRQLIRAETARQDFYKEGRVPEFVSDLSDGLRLHLDASIAVREGNLSEAHEILEKAEEIRPKLSGTCNENPFDDFRDLDDMSACFFEALTSSGKYYWIPFERVETIEFRAPERPIDLIWRSMNISVLGGPEGEVYLPTLYPDTAARGDNQLKLGRGTTWSENENEPIRGLGQRMFLVGEEARTAMELKTIAFDIQPDSEASADEEE